MARHVKSEQTRITTFMILEVSPTPGELAECLYSSPFGLYLNGHECIRISPHFLNFNLSSLYLSLCSICSDILEMI